jgi:hypothetical protein
VLRWVSGEEGEEKLPNVDDVEFSDKASFLFRDNSTHPK